MFRSLLKFLTEVIDNKSQPLKYLLLPYIAGKGH